MTLQIHLFHYTPYRKAVREGKTYEKGGKKGVKYEYK
jgi:hypothetical protein